MKTTDDGRTWPPSTAIVWRDVPGYEDLYQVSPDGRVRSLDREVIGRDGVRKSYRGCELAVVDGRVTLSRAGHVTPVTVSRVVAEVFGGGEGR